MSVGKIALVHDWLTGMRGGEKCLEVLADLFPDATLFTLLHNRGAVSPAIERLPIRTSFIQKMPGAARRYRHYLPLFPKAVERLDLSGHRVIVSSSHCVAKGVISPPGALHICYCYTPMRYVWDLFDDYFAVERVGWLKHQVIRRIAGRLRSWDARTAGRVHYFIAISHHVRERIQRHYGRTAEVIYPPVDTSFFAASEGYGDYFLVVSALAPYKRVDLAIEAFNRLGLRLLVIGTGPEEQRLKAAAKPNVEFLGWQPDEKLREYYAGCRALIFPGEEDFGIVPVEAMASGKPVIAFAKGGALETVIAGTTGLFFNEQTVDRLIDTVRRFDESRFSPRSIRAHALRFDREVYRREMKRFIEERYDEHFRPPLGRAA
jgi:glycosyltransferase involved in cell wall biosynthesis